MSINMEELEQLCKCGAIRLTEEEKPEYLHNLNATLDYVVDRFLQVDTEGVEPTVYVLADQCNVMREDVVGESLPQDDALANAPERTGEYFKVPRIL